MLKYIQELANLFDFIVFFFRFVEIQTGYI